MDRLGWLVVLLACGPAVETGPGTASGTETSAGEESEDTRDPGTSGDPTTISTSSTTTADPSLPSTVSTVDPDSSATMLPETDGVTDCPGGGGPLALGDHCVAGADCASGVCITYSDAPPWLSAFCDPAPDDCSTVVTGTVWRLPPGPAGLPNVPVRVVGALQAITDPQGADALVSEVSDEFGQIHGVSDGPITAAIALVAITGGDASYSLTGVGIASELGMGDYAVSTAVHDLWALPNDTLAAFNTALAADPSVPDTLLPLGDAGGSVGVVRDAGGGPIAGAVVSPVMGGSEAIIRYVTDTGDVDTVGTHASGAFIILGAVPTGEDFTATLDGVPVATGTVANAPGIVFALALTGV